MITIFLRFLKRLAVLVPGLVIAYLSIFNIFPFLSNHLPLVAAVLITYILGAYVFIPAIIRLVRILFPADHLPTYCITADGFASDPLNIGIIGTKQQLRQAMRQAGWHEADKLTLRSAARTILSTIYGWRYAGAPISNLYLFGRRQDIAFDMPIDNANTGSRHHVRFWAASYNENKRLTVKSINWQHRQEHVRDDKLLWVGAASRDIGITFIRHNAQITHLVDPDTDAERELIVDQLKSEKVASLHRTIKLGEPYRLRNLRGRFRHLKTDGRMKIMELTNKTTDLD